MPYDVISISLSFSGYVSLSLGMTTTLASPYIHNPPVKNYNNSYDYHYGSDATREADQPQPGFEERFQKLAVTGQQTFNTFLNSGFMKGVKDKVAS